MSNVVNSVSYQYHEIVGQMARVFEDKNHDYGDAFMRFRQMTFIDLIRAKLDRVENMLDMAENGDAPKVAEGVESEMRDIANYCVLMLIARELKNEQ